MTDTLESDITEHDCLDCGYHWVPDVADEVDDLDDEWAPIDLSGIARGIRDGTHQPTVPTVLAVESSSPLFYRERINSLFGESGGGKTWVALAAIAEVVRGGQRALFIDWEDNANGIAERLVLLGLTDDEIALVAYINPTTGIGRGVDALFGGETT